MKAEMKGFVIKYPVEFLYRFQIASFVSEDQRNRMSDAPSRGIIIACLSPTAASFMFVLQR